MFKRRPEERGGDQQDEAHQQACTLFAAQAGKGEQVDEIQGDRRGDDVHQHAGYLNRVDDDGALSDQHDDRSQDYRQCQQPGADAFFFATGLFQVESRPTSRS